MEVIFRAPEQEWTLRRSLAGPHYFSVLRELDEHLRERLKHADLDSEAWAELSEVRTRLREAVPDLDDDA